MPDGKGREKTFSLLNRRKFPPNLPLILIVALALLISSIPATPAGLSASSAEASAVSAVQVKAAYLYNFTLFVEWPQGSFSSPEEPITVCVLGDGQMADVLDATLKDKKSKGRSFLVKSSKWPQDLKQCHIVFVGPGAAKDPEKILRDFSAARALVVADMPGAAGQGAAINFFRDGERIRFEINLAEARKGGFTISSRMLQLARIVGTAGGDE